MGDESVSSWLKFFKDAGIPTGIGANYAVIFCDHRIQKQVLGDLTREILVDMGIKAMGDIMAILRHAKDVAHEVSREHTTKLLQSDVDESKVKSVVQAVSSSHVQPDDAKNETSSVFSRLGEDVVDTKSAGVFKRLGDPVVTTTTMEKPREVAVRSRHRTKISDIPEKREASTTNSKTSSKTVIVKRKHVLDRLGPEADNSESMRSDEKSKSVMQRLGRTPEPKDTNEKHLSSDEESPKILRIPSRMMARAKMAEDKLVVTKVVDSRTNKKSNVLNRLGGNSGPVIKRTVNTTSTAWNAKPTKKALAMDIELSMAARKPLSLAKSRTSQEVKRPTKRSLAMDNEPSAKKSAVVGQRQRPIKLTLAMDHVSESATKRLQLSRNGNKSSGTAGTGAFAKKALAASSSLKPKSHRLRLRLTAGSKPMSTESAGIFKTMPVGSSVFKRLGRQ